jgi:hypothetical protein
MNSLCNGLPFHYEPEEPPKFLKDVINTGIKSDTPSDETLKIEFVDSLNLIRFFNTVLEFLKQLILRSTELQVDYIAATA